MKIRDIVKISEDHVEYTPGGDRVVSRYNSDAEYSPGPHTSYTPGGDKNVSWTTTDAEYSSEQPAKQSAPSSVDKLAALQNLIGAKPDGIMGPETKQKLMIWQQSQGLKADGIPGPATYSKAGLSESTRYLDDIKKLSGLK